ncbi:MAG: class I tRNA ligase family protein, partial [Acidobacteria bacterium]|nr:class I tRNA ligase family protein [Acidobacteriota bacterium]
ELIWHEAGIEGAVRFLQRVWRLVHKWKDRVRVTPLGAKTADAATLNAKKLRQKTHQTIKRVEQNLESLQFNTPIAALMEMANAIQDFSAEPADAGDEDAAAVRDALTSLVLMLTPFAPHASEELYSHLTGHDQGILASDARFPDYNEDLARVDEIEIAVQVNGKLRSRVFAPPHSANDELEKLALADPKVLEHTDGKQIVKVVVVPGRLVNVVVKG